MSIIYNLQVRISSGLVIELAKYTDQIQMRLCDNFQINKNATVNLLRLQCCCL